MGRSLHNKIFGSTSCLSEEQLLKYGNDTLSQKEKHKVEKHLVECELCTDALEGFALIPAGPELNEVRAGVRQIAAQGKSVSVNYWKWVLVAASIAGVTFFSFLFLFQENKSGDKMLAGNKVIQQPLNEKTNQPSETVTEINEETRVAAERDVTVAEAEGSTTKGTGMGPSLKKHEDFDEIAGVKEGEKVSATLRSGKKAKDRDEDAGAFYRAANDQKAMQPVSDNEIMPEVALATPTGANEIKKEEEKPTALADANVRREITSSVTDKSEEPQKNYPALAESPMPVQKPVSGNKADGAETRKKKSKEPVFSGERKSLSDGTPSSASRDEVAAGQPKVKYIDNLKVVDYSDDYTSMAGAEVVHTPAKFENTEMAKKAEVEEQSQTQTLMYDDVLKEGLVGLEARNYPLAMEKFNLIRKNFPGDLNAVFYSGLVYYQQGNYDKALANFTIVTSSDNRAFHDEGNWYKALTYQKKNEKEKARAMLKQISEQESYYKKRASDMLDEMDKK